MNKMNGFLWSMFLLLCYISKSSAVLYARRKVSDVYSEFVLNSLPAKSEFECATKCFLMEKDCGAFVLRDNYCSLFSLKTDFCEGQQEIWVNYSKSISTEALVLFNGLNELENSEATVSSYPMDLGIQNLKNVHLHTAAAYFDGKIYFCGGSAKGSSNSYRNCYFTQGSGEPWVPAPSLATNRIFFTLTAVGSRLVAIGGYQWYGSDTIIGTSEYLEAGDVWRSGTSMNPTRGLHCTVALNDQEVIISGGCQNLALSSASTMYLKTVFKLNVFNGSSSALPSLRTIRLRHGCVMLSPNQMIVAGGQMTSLIHSSAVVEILDISAKTWSDLPSLPYESKITWLTVLNGNIIAKSIDILNSDLLVFTFTDVETNSGTWTVISNSRFIRKDGNMVKVPCNF